MIKETKLSELPSVAKECLTAVLQEKEAWSYGLKKQKQVLKGPNMYQIGEMYHNLWGWKWQEEIFFPRYFRMLHLLQLVKKNDEEWTKNHIHVANVNGEDQEYFECLGPGDCDYVLNEALERVQYRFRCAHEEKWGPIVLTKELVKEMNIFPESQLSMFGGDSYAEASAKKS